MGGASLFGYIRPFKPDLRFCEYDTYKSVYCGLCKTLRKKYGLIAQLFLNYDFTFLAMVSIALSNDKPQYQKGRCAFNPLKKCMYYIDTEQCLERAAAAVALMLYYKACDNISDSKGIKHIAAIIIRKTMKSMKRKAAESYNDLDKLISNAMNMQYKIEKDNCESIDMAAQPTGYMLSAIANTVCQTDNLERFAYLLGRWIYLIDAADDLLDDIKHNNYNVYIKKFHLNSLDEIQLKNIYKYINEILLRTQAELCYEYDKIKFNRFNDIIGNIIFEGIPSIERKIISEKFNNINNKFKGNSKSYKKRKEI